MNAIVPTETMLDEHIGLLAAVASSPTSYAHAWLACVRQTKTEAVAIPDHDGRKLYVIWPFDDFHRDRAEHVHLLCVDMDANGHRPAVLRLLATRPELGTTMERPNAAR